ncbi:MAG: LysR family transcriptional regulator [Myxococcales bacterium]|nr:LysR family transcriptional regulator [Myxococcales bacterium]
MRTVHDELAAVDLNLLRALDALLAERHVTRAAARLGLTQSAASHALARLRAQLGDPLLVRGPRGALVPTARAEALAPVVARALGELALVWRGVEFDPATTARTFHVGAGDFAELVLLPALVARLAKVAPRIDLFVRPVPDDIGGAMAAGEVDVVLAPARPRDLTGGCYQRHLFDETFTCAMRADHPAARARLTLDRFCALDHLLIAPRGTAGGFVDGALAALGRQRRVAVAVPHFLVAPLVLAATDLIATIPRRVAAAFEPGVALALRPPPLEVAGFGVHVLWHERTATDPAQAWLREQIVAVAGPPPAPRDELGAGALIAGQVGAARVGGVAALAEGRAALRITAGADGRAGRRRARQARAAVGGGGARAAGRLAAGAAPQRELGARHWQARQPAAVGAGGAGHADVVLRVGADDLGDGAARHAERVEVAGVVLEHVAGAAVGVGVARVGLQAADRAGRAARVAVVAAADRVVALLLTDHVRDVAVGQPGRAAAVAVLDAGLAGRTAAARRLADQHAGRPVGQAGPAAALAAADRQLAAHVVGAGAAHLAGAGAAGGAAGRDRHADAERGAGGDVAQAAAALAAELAGVAELRAVRRRVVAGPAVAVVRAAVGAARARVARGAARGVERRAGAVRAGAGAAGAVGGAALAVGGALVARAREVDARERAAVGAALAGAAGGEALTRRCASTRR